MPRSTKQFKRDATLHADSLQPHRVAAVNGTGKAGKRKGRRMAVKAATVRTYYIPREQIEAAPQDAELLASIRGNTIRVKMITTKEG